MKTTQLSLELDNEREAMFVAHYFAMAAAFHDDDERYALMVKRLFNKQAAQFPAEAEAAMKKVLAFMEARKEFPPVTGVKLVRPKGDREDE